MSTETKQPAQSADTNPNLQARYKPLGLRAVGHARDLVDPDRHTVQA